MRTVLSSDAEQSDKESDAHATSEMPCECPSIVLSCLPSKAFQILIVLSEANSKSSCKELDGEYERCLFSLIYYHARLVDLCDARKGK